MLFVHVGKMCPRCLTHWGREMHICVSKLTIIGPDNSLSPGRRQAIIWTNDGILLIGPSGTNFSGILMEIYTCSLKKMHFKMAFWKWRPFCLGLNVKSEYIRGSRSIPWLPLLWNFALPGHQQPWYCVIKTHVCGFFDTDLHEISWHFATHEVVRPSGF